MEILNSPLSEAGALGFEYRLQPRLPGRPGAVGSPVRRLRQCGPGVIDQFIASAEDKWQQLSGLVLLLPHGFEGMGPEHSSARLERFLQLAAEDNIQVVPHHAGAVLSLLRRQALQQWRKPLVVFTPKEPPAPSASRLHAR